MIFATATEQISTFARLINDYGGYAVILAIFLAIFLYIVHSNNKSFKNLQKQIMENNNTYQHEIMEQNEKLIEQIMVAKHDAMPEESKNKKDLFDTFTKLKLAIKHNCTTTLNNVKADRIAVYLFHNGTRSTHGISFFKMTCICEKVLIGSGVVEHSIEQSNIPINLFDDMIEMLISNGHYTIHNTEELSASNHRIFISSKKIQYAQAVAIFDLSNNILGFVLAEFSHDLTNEEKEKKDLITLSKQLVPVLSYSEYADANLENNNPA